MGVNQKGGKKNWKRTNAYSGMMEWNWCGRRLGEVGWGPKKDTSYLVMGGGKGKKKGADTLSREKQNTGKERGVSNGNVKGQ